MKKIFLISALVLIAGMSFAQTWHTANQVTFAWTAVAPIQPTDTMVYQVYTKFKETTATPQAVGGEITSTSMPVSFTVEGKYYLCAQTIRYVQGETEPLKSDIACSHEAEVTLSGVAFGVKFFIKPDRPNGERLQ